jgi:Fe-S-cluster containining protein
MEIRKETSLKEIISLGKDCKKCGNCCSYDSGFIAKNEIKGLAKHFKLKEKDFENKFLRELKLFNNTVYKFKLNNKEKPYGPCILYSKEKGCTIQKIKPLHCKIGNCNKYGEQLSAWFTVNFLVNKNNPESIRQFNQYIKSGGKTIPGGDIKDLIKDKKQLKDILSYNILS